MGICLNCFYNNLSESVCPKCKYDNSKEVTKPLMLPPLTTLFDGRYLIGRVLGAGGFGITYKAYDNVSKKLCAIKEYAPLNIAQRDAKTLKMKEVGDDKKKIYYHCKKRFYEEAQAIYKCRKIPEIVAIEAYFEENNTSYFAMEYIGDSNLRGLMRKNGGKIELEKAISIISKIGMGLSRVHKEVGIFHRDISPENIMLGRDAEIVKLIDFGSAKFIARSETEVVSGLTVVLKPGYAPPEQYYSNGKQGAFTDVYALAATFYYAVTGVMVPDATRRAMGNEPYKKLTEYGIEGMTERISDAVDAALDLDHKKRTQSVEEFVHGINGERITITSLMDQEKESDITETIQSSEDQIKQLMEEASRRNKVSYKRVPYVKVIRGEGAGTSWNLPIGRGVVIGRAGRDADVIVTADNKEISRRHIKICYVKEKDAFEITELNSKNGTSIRGVEMESGEVKTVPKGERIVLGLDAMEIEVGVQNG